MKNKILILPLIIAVVAGLAPMEQAQASLTYSNIFTTPLNNVQMTTISPSISPTTPIIVTGKLVGCSGAVIDERPLSNQQYSYDVVWTFKHALYKDLYFITVTDDSGSPADSISGVAGVEGGIPNTYVMPKRTYKLNSTEPSKVVKLQVVAKNYENKVLSNVACQITLTNKQSYQLPPVGTITTLPGLQQPSFVIPGSFSVPDSGLGSSEGTSSGESSASSSSTGSSSSGTSSGASAGSSSASSPVGTSSGSSSGKASSTPMSGSTNTTGSTAGSNSSSNSTTTAATEAPPLKQSPDLLSCKGTAKTLYFENDLPAYDRMGITCFLTMPGIVRAGIYTDKYDPKAEDNSANLVKMVLQDSHKEKGRVYLSWNGYDDYDQEVAMEKYKFVVEARPGFDFAPDISIHSFEIKNPPAVEPAEETAGVSAPVKGTNGSAGADNLHGAAAGEGERGVLEQLGEAVFGSEVAETEAVAVQPTNREASKCPTVFYPIDISGHPYEALIKKAFDECLVKGYADGTFRMDQGLTRAEATKVAILASGNLAKQGCYDNDCGSPFMDLELWQGPWVRSAWDLKIVSGLSPDRFAPNRAITRAEAVALTAKAFKIPPHYGCYNAHCGAGLPNDPFNDIVHMWQGQYLRALTDKGILQTLSPGRFYPDQPITRGQFVEMVYRAKSLK